MIKLSPRLDAVAQMAGSGGSVIDVGTDHGYLPVYFVQSGLFERVAASDINAGPLWSARCSARERGVEERIEFYLSDGLRDVPGKFGTVVIAGMGGETMVDIIKNCPWAGSARLVLQPQSKVTELADYLGSAGFGCRDARLVRDAGKPYVVFAAVAGGGFDLAGTLLSARDGLLPELLEREAGRVRAALAGMERGGEAGEEYRARLERLERYIEEVSSWRR